MAYVSYVRRVLVDNRKRLPIVTGTGTGTVTGRMVCQGPNMQYQLMGKQVINSSNLVTMDLKDAEKRVLSHLLSLSRHERATKDWWEKYTGVESMHAKAQQSIAVSPRKRRKHESIDQLEWIIWDHLD